MSKQLAESLIRLAGLYLIITTVIGLATVAVTFLQGLLSSGFSGLGFGGLFWYSLTALVSLAAGAFVLRNSSTLADVVVSSD